jgi:hypothetical protein
MLVIYRESHLTKLEGWNIHMAQAELYRDPHAKFIRAASLEEIVREYMHFALPLRRRYHIKFEGRMYSGDEIHDLLDRVEKSWHV